MPSLVVHVAAACLLAAVFLEDAYSPRAVLVVVGATLIPDADTFVGLVVHNAHRAALHNVFVPLALLALAAYDLRVREDSWLRRQFGTHGGRVAGVAILAVAVAATGLDFVTNGVNLFYPLHDQFYAFSGHLELSSTRGLVQTFVQTAPAQTTPSNTQNTHYSTVVSPTWGRPSGPVERVAPIVASGWQLWLVCLGYGAVVWRVRRWWR